jgi:NADPH:quinone reductase-like Zn-dependent oxidoreductase
METMKAVRIHQYGGPEELKLEDVPRPQPGAGEVVTRVHAAGVNPIDWKIRAGYVKDFMQVPMPFIPGIDISGVVEATGPGVTLFKKGDEVFGVGSAGYAAFAVAKESELALKPASLDHVHAAAVPVVASTTWQALLKVAGLKAGQKLLVHGAAGGLGIFAVQFAKAKGAHVIGTASGRHQSFLRELGVDEPIDYAKTKFEDVAHDVDVVLDTQGGDTQLRSWNVLKKGGVLISVVQPPSEEEAAKHGVKAVMFRRQENTGELSEIAKLVDSGSVKVVVETVLPLSDARRAQELSQAGHVRGKIVLKVA